MSRLLPPRHTDLNHHYLIGKTWLEESQNGKNTTALCYAAFEFRLQIERIGLQHWSALKPGGFDAKDLLNARSFKAIENHIYKLAGYQREIDLRYEFARILMSLLKLDEDFPTPKLGQLSTYWHECSELCHIASSFALADAAFAHDAYEYCMEISNLLEGQIKALATIGKLPSGGELERKFISGEMTAADVRRHLTRTGIWARVEYNDGRPTAFIGEAIPPSTETDEQ